MKKILIILILLNLSSCSSEYEKRENKVYYRFWSFGQGGWNEKVVENADLKSFCQINSEDNLYGKDKSNVYYENVIIPGADPNTFKHLKRGYAVDINRAYYYNDSIANSSPKEFEIIDGYFSKDWKNVFYTDKSLDVCSVNDFTFVYKDEKSFLERWSTDGCYYYFNNYKVPSEDYKNIVLFKGSNGISKDTEFVYYKDQKYILPNERMVLIKEKGIMVKDTIDIKTFTVENYICKDKFGRIN
ncbi:DKNYY domain-containing protein [Mesonia aquimarina]|uniref:DKNYY domain-containing protein n=1 Tax=Mesonia aquimarina TaxID=1504967 RepID=UPI0013CE8BB6|nr:DKNYY domain-containing protein [Mesonia aquimarina]